VLFSHLGAPQGSTVPYGGNTLIPIHRDVSARASCDSTTHLGTDQRELKWAFRQAPHLRVPTTVSPGNNPNDHQQMNGQTKWGILVNY
jgi:hypothetical protein